ncbi:SMI1/KNR4 family protein [Sphingobacterium sp. BIGb0116]|uniref:SMI1/KNR4 family protein n=1 Tax=Sphingobacterium sp. BIGb0116 TaxID=2940619 RepID=UPI002168F19C|nr:hypothetical protein [Sphingobacterium sp. BIGb0116]MCS4165183.1 hypothetical protein [Sphingobacterium sp. BIGb0116]
MKNEIEILEKHLLEINSQALNYLNPPIQGEKLNKFILENYGDYYLESLNDLYSWHNGLSRAELPENHRLTYLADQFALTNLEDVRQIINSQNDTFYQFIKNKLFPFAQSFNGEYYAVSFVDYKVYFCSTFDYEIEPIVSIFNDLIAMIKTQNSWFDNKCLVLNEFQEIELDLSKYSHYLEIGWMNNPNTDYWKIKKEIEGNI